MKLIDGKVLCVLKDHFKRSSYAPTIMEIADMLKINSSGYVHESLSRLRDQGLVSWEPSKVRTLSLTDAGRQYETTA